MKCRWCHEPLIYDPQRGWVHQDREVYHGAGDALHAAVAIPDTVVGPITTPLDPTEGSTLPGFRVINARSLEAYFSTAPTAVEALEDNPFGNGRVMWNDVGGDPWEPENVHAVLDWLRVYLGPFLAGLGECETPDAERALLARALHELRDALALVSGTVQ